MYLVDLGKYFKMSHPSLRSSLIEPRTEVESRLANSTPLLPNAETPENGLSKGWVDIPTGGRMSQTVSRSRQDAQDLEDAPPRGARPVYPRVAVRAPNEGQGPQRFAVQPAV